jgi:hypothetical protein
MANAEALESVMRDNYTQTVPAQPYEHPCTPLTKILSSGSFYYAVDSRWDLSSRLSRRISGNRKTNHDLGTFDERFVWNEYIVRCLLDFRERLDPHEREELDQCQFVVCVWSLPRSGIHNSRRTDISHTRLRRGFQHGASGAPNQWQTNNCHTCFALPSGLEASRYSFQYSRC